MATRGVDRPAAQKRIICVGRATQNAGGRKNSKNVANPGNHAVSVPSLTTCMQDGDNRDDIVLN